MDQNICARGIPLCNIHLVAGILASLSVCGDRDLSASATTGDISSFAHIGKCPLRCGDRNTRGLALLL